MYNFDDDNTMKQHKIDVYSDENYEMTVNAFIWYKLI